MASSLKYHPQWVEDFRCEAVQHSLDAYRRARRMRMLFILSFLAVAALQIGFPEATSEVVSAPVLMGIVFFLSFFTFAAEWATRRQYAECLERCASLLEN